MNSECICHIREVYRTIAVFEQTLRQHYGLNFNEAVLLCIVSERKNISSGELAEEMELTCSNTSKVISALENMRLIVRHPCKEDLRSMKFSITKKGANLLSEINCGNVELPEGIRELASKSALLKS